MRNIWALLLLFTATILAEEIAPETIEISGKFGFEYVDANGNFAIHNGLKLSDMSDASSWSLVLISEDQYYNTYPGYFTLTAVQNTVVPIFSMKSKYITESGKYRDIPIESAKINVGDQTADEILWNRDFHNGNIALIDFNTNSGKEMFENLT